MKQFYKNFSPDFMEEKRVKDREAIIDSTINHSKVILIKENNSQKHPFSILDDRWERRTE